MLELFEDFEARQIVMEMKNVDEVKRQDINQLNRYLAPDLSHFGVRLTRNELKKTRLKQTIDLWSAHRKVIIVLSDADIDMMVELFKSHQRLPLDVINKKFYEFRQKCPA